MYKNILFVAILLFFFFSNRSLNYRIKKLEKTIIFNSAKIAEIEATISTDIYTQNR